MLTVIRRRFAADFRHWRIRLPHERLEDGVRGDIRQDGWHIQYSFGRDELGEFLDYYARHRMTSDRHRRIYESGRVEDLPASFDMIVYPRDVTPEQVQAAHDMALRQSNLVSEELRRKGFD